MYYVIALQEPVMNLKGGKKNNYKNNALEVTAVHPINARYCRAAIIKKATFRVIVVVYLLANIIVIEDINM
jgi:hypothetical protein